jgi:hypothetical protein
MTSVPRYPSLFQINTGVWRRYLLREGGKKPVTPADLDDATIDGFAVTVGPTKVRFDFLPLGPAAASRSL